MHSHGVLIPTSVKVGQLQEGNISSCLRAMKVATSSTDHEKASEECHQWVGHAT
jgi:hypothetical protein